MVTTLRRVTPLALVGGLLAVLAVVASMSAPGIHRFKPRQPAHSPSPRPSHIAPSNSGTSFATDNRSGAAAIPTWIQPVLIAIGAVIVLVLVAFLVWRIVSNTIETRAARLGRKPATVGTTRREAVLAVVDAGIAELARDDRDPRSAVIICWVRLEELAAAAGAARSTGDTPAELARRLLSVHDVTPDVLDTLANLYRAARYSPDHVFPSMRDDARHAFIRLRDELATMGSDSGPESVRVTSASRPRPRHSFESRSGGDRP